MRYVIYGFTLRLKWCFLWYSPHSSPEAEQDQGTRWSWSQGCEALILVSLGVTDMIRQKLFTTENSKTIKCAGFIVSLCVVASNSLVWKDWTRSGDYLVSFCNKLLCLRLALSVAPSQMSCKVLTAEIWADDTVTPSTSQRSQIRPWWVRVKFQNILPFPLFWTTNDMPCLFPETGMSSVFWFKARGEKRKGLL